MKTLNIRKGTEEDVARIGQFYDDVIHALAIDPQKQKRGIGTETLQFCVARAKAENYKSIRADIVPTNDPARRLFEKNGFVYVGDTDLELSIGGIPEFSLYELNF